MLSHFAIRKTFNKLIVKMFVDCDMKEASILVLYDHRIMRDESIMFHEVRDIALAEAYLSRQIGEHGSFVETLEWQCRIGVLSFTR